MKRVLFLVLVVVLFLSKANAKTVTVKSGTIVALESVKELRAADAHVGETIDFKLLRDVKVDGQVAIPAGTIAKGTVYEAKRSSCFGTKGRLGIKLRYLTLDSGDVINFASSDIYIQGKNRTPVSIIVFCVSLLPIPCGSKAVLPVGYECEATIAANTEVPVK